MTYRQLLKALQEVNGMRLDDDATIYDKTNDEYYPVGRVKAVGDECDVLDEGHIIITIET